MFAMKGRGGLAGLAIGMAISFTGPGNAASEDTGNPGKGLAFAKQVCADCHGVLANEKVSPRFNIATFKRIAESPGMTGTALWVWFQTPHPNMPNLVIENDDKRDLIAYILSLKEP